MHVLGLPPAFVLSQDQTLKLKAPYDAILDERTSAHHRSSRSLTVHFFRFVLKFHRNQEPQNSEADTTIIAEAKWSIYRRPIHRNEPNRPHIPSSPNFQKAEDKNFSALPMFTGCAAVLSSCPPRFRSVPTASPPSVSGYLGRHAAGRKRKKRGSTKIRHRAG